MKQQLPECKQCGECCKCFAVNRVIKTKYLVDYAIAHGYIFDGTFMIIPSICPQLDDNGKCKIYKTRPEFCRDYGNTKSIKAYYPVGCVYRRD